MDKIPVFDLHADTYYKKLLLHQHRFLRRAFFHRSNLDNQLVSAQEMISITPENLILGNVKVQAQSLYLAGYSLQGALHNSLQMVQMMKKDIALNENLFQVRNTEDVTPHLNDDKTGIYITIEGLEVIEGNLDLLDIFAELGVRMVAPTWNRVLPFVPSFLEGGGMFRRGKDLAAKMNELSLIMDISHMSPEASLEMANLLHTPIIASHANLLRLNAFPRNLTDRQMDMLKERNGIIGLTFCPDFLRIEQESFPSDGYPIGYHYLYRIISEIIDNWGIEMIALGSDFDGLTDIEQGLEDPACYPSLAEFLSYKGMNKSEIRKIFFDNALRAISQ
ncbi:MAG TPA: membrane dipeptidase [Candidatus Cloacimonadota bacterium]|nr:membrane dipeptidase [Candidatus Cloacimonadota bacterium]HPT72222.1 membrane dipeptidase [Candidatus Cloacimonadota bacterium]